MRGSRIRLGVTRVCEVFSGNDEAAVALARVRWKDYLAVGHTLSYWQQGERGWEKKANT
jgi:DNA polymerase-3 subunit chi